MKKILILTTALILLSVMSFSQSITVTNPRSGENVVKGERYTIRWTITGQMADTVKIRLYNRAGTDKILEISNSTENSGRYSCPPSLFNSIRTGDYVIRVKTTDNSYYDDSDVFHLVDAEESPEPEPERVECYSISFSQPRDNGRTNWGYGEHEIRWRMRVSPPCDTPDNVRLELRNEANTSTVLTIAANTRNDGRHSWVIPDSVTQGNYKIRLTTVGPNPFVVTSGSFHVGNSILEIVPLDLRVIDLRGRITDRELKVAYMKSFRWRIKCKVRIRSLPASINLENILVTWKLSDSSGREKYSNSYIIATLNGGSEHVKSINLECGDDKYKRKRPRLAEGDYYIEVKIDPSDTKRDRNLRNNTFRWRFTLKK